MKEANIAPKFGMRKMMVRNPNSQTFPTMEPSRHITYNIIRNYEIKVESKSTANYERLIMQRKRFEKFFTRRLPQTAGIGSGAIGRKPRIFQHRWAEIKRELERIRSSIEPRATSSSSSWSR